ncbi:cysteine rich repeat-containing protein [Bosea thiooxidans]
MIRLALATLLLTAAVPALAQDRGARAACRADFERNCPGIKPGGGRLIACMREKQASFSDGCKEALKAARAQRQEQ